MKSNIRFPESDLTYNIEELRRASVFGIASCNTHKAAYLVDGMTVSGATGKSSDVPFQ